MLRREYQAENYISSDKLRNISKHVIIKTVVEAVKKPLKYKMAASCTKSTPLDLLQSDTYQELQEFEQKVFGPVELSAIPVVFPSSNIPSFGLGFPKIDSTVPQPTFGCPTATSIFDNAALNIPPSGFTFGASNNDKIPPTGTDSAMDGS
ncbi:hypothetical protein GIB67_013303 [Kingdonia uniflora]|uniref:Uncharacterized protein n=1 Tax=Kingdonia uniflora TaxID=39325 RepID=A0A7J7LQX9_9MAGN|nr:hypothetical protein GIB67_013303 [Kingdonia uniflora]